MSETIDVNELAAEPAEPVVLVEPNEPDEADQPAESVKEDSEQEEAEEDYQSMPGDEEVPDIECGFCLRRNLAMEDPKVLPCNHIHCLECLNSYFDLNHVVICPTLNCGRACEDNFRELSDHRVEKNDDESLSCHVCVSTEEDNSLASIYCVECSKRFCDEHVKEHDNLLGSHQNIEIKRYKDDMKKLEKRMCSEHTTIEYSMGCKVCRIIFCVNCIDELGPCTDGAPHKPIALFKLVKMLMEDDVKTQVLSKENQLEKLFKEASKANSEYDAMTAELIKSLHERRDDQIRAIRQKYNNFEAELLAKRRETKVMLAEFLEENVNKKWGAIRNYRLKVESRDRYSHDVDIVQRFQEVKDEMEKFLEEELPKLEIDTVVSIQDKCEHREIELDFGVFHGLAIDIVQGFVPKPWIKSVNKSKTVSVTNPSSISCHNGEMYVGSNKNTLVKIGSSNQPEDLSIKCSEEYISSVKVHKGRVYTYSGVAKVSVFDLSGELIKDWEHASGGSSYNDVLAIVSDQIVLPDKTNARLTVYALNGDIVKHISNPQLSDTVVSMCAINDDSVLVCLSNQVFRVNVANDNVMWTCEGLSQVKGATQCDNKIALLALNGKISMLDVEKGRIISELTNSDLPSSSGHGLEVHDTTLIVTSYDTSEAIFYQLT